MILQKITTLFTKRRSLWLCIPAILWILSYLIAFELGIYVEPVEIIWQYLPGTVVFYFIPGSRPAAPPILPGVTHFDVMWIPIYPGRPFTITGDVFSMPSVYLKWPPSAWELIIHLPWWLCFLLCAIIWKMLARNENKLPAKCVKCGYDLSASPEVCPECGNRRTEERGRV